jgi:hypothetical protein
MKKKRLIITAGAKGGTGKTLTTTLLHAWLIDQQIRVTLFDGDSENSTLSRFVPGSMFIDMRDPAALDEILVPLQFDEADVVLLDSRAATTDELISWLQQLGVQALQEELLTRVTIVAMVTHSRDTLEQLKRWTGSLGADVDWLIARNLIGGQVEEYDASQLRTTVLKKLRAGEISIPLIPAYVVRELEQHGLTISQARLAQGISWANRRRCQFLHEQLSAQCAATKNNLLP